MTALMLLLTCRYYLQPVDQASSTDSVCDAEETLSGSADEYTDSDEEVPDGLKNDPVDE